jgi:hypothetical protein
MRNLDLLAGETGLDGSQTSPTRSQSWVNASPLFFQNLCVLASWREIPLLAPLREGPPVFA